MMILNASMEKAGNSNTHRINDDSECEFEKSRKTQYPVNK